MQLSLPIHQLDDESLTNFHSDNNLLLLNSLRKNFSLPNQPFFYLWGEQGSGKTHLLKGIFHDFLRDQRSAIYVPLEKSQYFSPAVLENLENQELVCLDNLHCICSHWEWETAVFDLFNRIKENRKTLLLISANQSPNGLNISLPDLRTRLTWGEIYQLQPLDEHQRIKVLQQNAYQRGMELSDDTANFLMKRLDRDMHSLLAALDRLDKASLQAQRKLTIPFVKEILGL